MKRLVLIILIFILITAINVDIVSAETDKGSLDDKIESSINKLDLSALDNFIKENFGESDSILKDIRAYIQDIIDGNFNLSFFDVISKIFTQLFKDLLSFLPLVITVLAISLLFSIMDGLSSNFTSHGTREIIYFASFTTIIVVVITSVSLLLKDAKSVINKMYSFMEVIFPILLTLMTSLGGAVTVSLYQPLMAGLSFFVSVIITKVVIPLFLASLVFSIVGNLTSNIKLDKMTSAIKSVGEFVLGIIFSIFTAFITLEGITGNNIDNVSIKSAKFAISSYVPILGGYLTEGFDLALASIVLIKNSIGVIGIIVILLLALSPVIKIAVFILTLKITAGIIEPICDSRIASFVESISKNMSLLIAILLGVMFMFLMMCMFAMLTLNAVI